jgi:predicted dinucleotide-binding enzyme
MNIAILGTGNMAKGLATVFAAGNQVTLGGRTAGAAQEVAAAYPGVRGNDIAGAADGAEIVFLAVPFGSAAEVVAAAGGLAGKIVVDLTNPMKADFSGLAIGHTTSAAEEIAKAAPGARVVKGFNTLFAQVLQAGGKVAGRPATVFLAGDDAAVDAVAALSQGAGLKVIRAGGLAAARNLEPLGALNIALGYGLGHGTGIAPEWAGIE